LISVILQPPSLARELNINQAVSMVFSLVIICPIWPYDYIITIYVWHKYFTVDQTTSSWVGKDGHAL